MSSATSEELSVTVRRAASGEVIATVRIEPSNTVAQLCEAALRETGSSEAGLLCVALLGNRALDSRSTLEECGVANGDEVGIVKVTLGCLTVSAHGIVRTWRLQGRGQNAAPVASLDVGQDLKLAAACPKASMVATVDCEGTGTLWRVETGERTAALGKDITSIRFSADGSHIAGACDDGRARIWDATTGKCLQVLTGHGEDADVRLAVFSPDGFVVATADSDGQVCLFEAVTGALMQTFSGHTSDVKSLEFSFDGQCIVTGSHDATARVWNTSSGECLQVFKGHSKGVRSATFSPSGRQVLTSSFDGTARVWSAVSGTCTTTFVAENSVVSSAVFSPDGGASVLLAPGSPTVRLFTTTSGECLQALAGHEDWVRSATYSPDGSLVATASFDGTARIFNVASGECLQTLAGGSGDLLMTRVVSG